MRYKGMSTCYTQLRGIGVNSLPKSVSIQDKYAQTYSGIKTLYEFKGFRLWYTEM